MTSKKPVEVDKSRGPLIFAVLLILGLGITAGAVAWGRSDAGQINVAATINNSETQIGGGEGTHTLQAATAEHSALPNGGLEAASPTDSTADAPAPTPIVTEETPSTTPSEGGDEVSGEITSETPVQ